MPRSTRSKPRDVALRRTAVYFGFVMVLTGPAAAARYLGDAPSAPTGLGNGPTVYCDNTYCGPNPPALGPPIQVFGAVPEPSAWGLTVVGFGALGAAVRRRRARPLFPFGPVEQT